jgi:hypothetical protein
MLVAVPDRYDELRGEMLHLLDSHALSEMDREKLCRLSRTDDWADDHDWAYARGVVSSVLEVIDVAGREARAGGSIRPTAREDLKAVLAEHTCETR